MTADGKLTNPYKLQSWSDTAPAAIDVANNPTYITAVGANICGTDVP